MASDIGRILGAAAERAATTAKARTRGTFGAVLISSEPAWGHAIEWLLTAMSVRVLAHAYEVDRALELVTRTDAQLLVVDAGDGADPTRYYRRLRDVYRARPNVATIVLSPRSHPTLRESVLAAGAVRAVVREDAADLIHGLDAICAAVDDGTPLQRSTLTRRELEILRLIAPGRSNREVAELLWVTEQTVKYHLANAYRKLGVRTRADAVRWAATCGLAGRAAPVDPQAEAGSSIASV